MRFDIDPSVHPDIQGTLTDTIAVAAGSVNAVYSSHNIEHVFPHEVHSVLLEFHRLLREDGIVVLTCPDLRRPQVLTNLTDDEMSALDDALIRQA